MVHPSVTGRMGILQSREEKKRRGYKIGLNIDQKCVLVSGQRRRLTEFLMLEIFSRIQKGRALLGLYPFNLFGLVSIQFDPGDRRHLQTLCSVLNWLNLFHSRCQNARTE